MLPASQEVWLVHITRKLPDVGIPKLHNVGNHYQKRARYMSPDPY